MTSKEFLFSKYPLVSPEWFDDNELTQEMIKMMDEYCDAEVEKRISERMPSEEDVEINLASFDEITNDWFDFTHAVYHWLRSRLTKLGDKKADAPLKRPVFPPDRIVTGEDPMKTKAGDQKTEGGRK